MSRHRSPGGRRVPRESVPVPHRSTTRRGAPFASPTRSALRNAVAAATVARGTLALAAPAVALVGAPGSAADHHALQRATDRVRPGDASAAMVTAAYPGGIRTVAAVVPVAQPAEPGPEQLDAAGLLKAVGLADLARRGAEAEPPAPPPRAECDVDVGTLGGVKPWVATAARFLSCLYDRPDLIGVAGRGRVSDHPAGRAVDLMARGGNGDRIAECALRNREALGISYVIWKQRINYGDGWEPMADRGSATENHFDHVHLSFDRGAPASTPDVELCR